jgi:transketolase
MHTLKPMDDMAVIHAAHETGVIITAEEHQIGALAGRVSQIITSTPRLYGVPIITGAIGVKDRFGESGGPWELIKEFEVSAEHICRKACELLNVKQQVIQEEAVTAEL